VDKLSTPSCCSRHVNPIIDHEFIPWLAQTCERRFRRSESTTENTEGTESYGFAIVLWYEKVPLERHKTQMKRMRIDFHG
jgi:hypothetical protein